MPAIDALLARMKEENASDLHVNTGTPPRFRVQGRLVRVLEAPTPTSQEIRSWLEELLSEPQKNLFHERGELDFAHGDVESGRFRCNYFQEQRGPAATFRRIPGRIPTLGDLNLPPVVENLAHYRSGLVLVTGPAGSGKTSTLAAVLNLINAQYRKHIMTLEDPIEYLHPHLNSIVHQRELNTHLPDFASGIRAALREDPDVLLIGELRDIASIRLALTAAGIGILVFATLHTNGAPDAVDRIIDVFPADEQPQVRSLLSQCLAAVVSQLLLLRADGEGRVPATEILFATPAVSNLIREGKIHEIMNVIQAGKSLGMRAMDDSLAELLQSGLVPPQEAYKYASNKESFAAYLPEGWMGRRTSAGGIGRP